MSLFQLAAVATLCIAITFGLGTQQTLYLLHGWAFSDTAQWSLYFEDSLMSKLMPEIVFANIATLIGIRTVQTWLVANFLLRHILA